MHQRRWNHSTILLDVQLHLGKARITRWPSNFQCRRPNKPRPGLSNRIRKVRRISAVSGHDGFGRCWRLSQSNKIFSKLDTYSCWISNAIITFTLVSMFNCTLVIRHSCTRSRITRLVPLVKVSHLRVDQLQMISTIARPWQEKRESKPSTRSKLTCKYQSGPGSCTGWRLVMQCSWTALRKQSSRMLLIGLHDSTKAPNDVRLEHKSTSDALGSKWNWRFAKKGVQVILWL